MMLIIERVDDDDERVIVTTDGGATQYRLTYDDVWDEWQATSDDDSMVQGEWFPTRDDGLSYIYYRCGLFDEPDFERSFMDIT